LNQWNDCPVCGVGREIAERDQIVIDAYVTMLGRQTRGRVPKESLGPSGILRVQVFPGYDEADGFDEDAHTS
jgi:hypothetical protein